MLTEPTHAVASLLAPRSIAIVGASTTSYVGRVLCENLRQLGYEGSVFPVNPRYDEVMGWPCFPSLEALPAAPEAVVSAVRIDWRRRSSVRPAPSGLAPPSSRAAGSPRAARPCWPSR